VAVCYLQIRFLEKLKRCFVIVYLMCHTPICSLRYFPSFHVSRFIKMASGLNPNAPEFIPAAHRNVCDTVSRFINTNVGEMNRFMASLLDGEPHPEVKTPDGRMAFVDYTFFIEFYVPFPEQPPAGYVNLKRVMNRINRLLVTTHELCMSGVAGISSSYDTDKKMLIVKGILEECE
jgi:hypothetical protein